MPVGVILRPGQLTDPFWIYDYVIRHSGSMVEGLNIKPLAWYNRFARNYDRALDALRATLPQTVLPSGEPANNNYVNFIWWDAAMRYFWFIMFDGKDLMDKNLNYTWQWIRNKFYTSPYGYPEYINASALDWLYYLGRMGVQLYMTEPLPETVRAVDIPDTVWKQLEKDRTELFYPGKPPGFIDTIIITAIKIGTLYAVTSGIGELLPEDTLLDDLAEATANNIEEFFSMDNLIEVGADVLAGTIEGELNNVQDGIIDELNVLDSQIALDLSPLTDAVTESTRELIADITGTIQEGTSEVVYAMIDRLEDINKHLTEPESMEAMMHREANLSNGMGYALGLKRVFFKGV